MTFYTTLVVTTSIIYHWFSFIHDIPSIITMFRNYFLSGDIINNAIL